MTDKPINIPALIARIRSLLAHEIDTKEADVRMSEILAALEQAQAEIAREKSRADAAESSEIRMSTLVGKLSDALDHAVAVHIRAQEDGPRLREALRAVAPLLIPGITWTDETGQLVKRMVREALAATPPAAFALPPADDAASAEADRFTAEHYARMGKRIVRPATPPAAEPAGQGDDDADESPKPCEGCSAPATTEDVDGVPLCGQCAQACIDSPDCRVESATQQGDQQNEEDALTKYERLAEQFYRDTGMMAPGKDAPGQREDTFSERQATWGEWLAKRMCRQKGEQQEARNGDGLCPYCDGSGEDAAEERYAAVHSKGRAVSAWCGHCNGTGKKQEARP